VLLGDISTLALMGDAFFRQFQLLKQRELLVVERFLKEFLPMDFRDALSPHRWFGLFAHFDLPGLLVIGILR